MKQSKRFLKATTAILYATIMLMFGLVSCGQVTGGASAGSSSGSSSGGSGREATINIKLPQFSASSQSIRSISDDDLPELKLATKSFRVTFRSSEKTVVREVSSDTTNIQATFHVGTEVSIVIECLDASGKVIVRTEPKTIKVQSSNNTIRFILSEDGTKIEPAPDPTPEPEPEPDPGPEPSAYKVTYNGGADDAQGVPSDSATYETGNIVSLAPNEPTRNGFTFMGWTANVALTGNGNGQVQISSGKTFVYSSSAVIADYEINNFSMPEGGVTLTAQWISSSYDMIEIDSPEKLQKYATKMQNGTNVQYPNGTTVAANQASYKLTKDLDVDGMSGILLSSANYQFAGDFDGNGYKIKNLSDSDGLFHDVAAAGIIRNLILENVNITIGNYNQASPFALTMNGNLIGCQVSGSITSSYSKYALAVGSGSVAGCLASIDSNFVNGLCQVNTTQGAAFATDSTDVDTLNTKISEWNSLGNTLADSRLKCDWHFERTPDGQITLVRGAP